MANPNKLAVALSKAVAPKDVLWAVPGMLVINGDDQESLADGLIGMSGDTNTKEAFFHYIVKPLFGSPSVRTLPRSSLRGFQVTTLRTSFAGDVEGLGLVGTRGDLLWWIKGDMPERHAFLTDKVAKFLPHVETS
jgi:hypothetical protein